MSKTPLFLIALLLASVGLGVFAYKLFALHFPLVPDQVSSHWKIEASVSFVAQGKSAKVSSYIPKSTQRFAILDESFISRGFGLSTVSRDGNRAAEWAIRKISGRQSLFYSAIVRQQEHADSASPTKPPEISDPGFEGAELEAAQAIVTEAKAQSADVLSQVRAVVQRMRASPLDDAAALLLGSKPTELDRLSMATRVLAIDRVPVRIVHGIRLQAEGRKVPIIRWLEVHDRSQWISLDAEGNPSPEMASLLPWWRGTDPLGFITGGTKLNIDVSVSQHEEQAIVAALESGKSSKPFLLEFSLYSLPLQTQAVFRVMLLVPLGGLLIVLLRNVVGLPTFGTFMPVLVALAFRETDILMGCLFFSLVVALGLLVRFWLERLKLLLVPRLAAVLTIVVLLLAIIAIASHKFGVEHGLSIALFPMVILTMTIERMSIIWDELGPADALKQGFGSLFAAVLATLIMSGDFVEHLFFVFPELLLVITAICLLLGRYTGYRLTELYRFRALVGKS